MADRVARASRPADDPLAALNDHLGRFLRQADDLLDEWARFGADVRVRVTADADRLGDAVATAVDASVDRAAARVTDQVAARLTARLADLTTDLDRLSAQVRRASAIHLDQRRTSRLTLAVLALSIVSNVLLAVVLALLWPRPVRPPDPPVEKGAMDTSAPSAAPVPDAAVADGAPADAAAAQPADPTSAATPATVPGGAPTAREGAMDTAGAAVREPDAVKRGVKAPPRRRRK